MKVHYRYISVAGITAASQAASIATYASGIIKGLKEPHEHIYPPEVLLGIQVSPSSLLGTVDPESASQFPSQDEIQAILQKVSGISGVRAVLHWCTKEGGPLLYEQVSELLRRFPLATGIQINSPKPEPVGIERIRLAYPEHTMIVQIGGDVLSGLGEGLDAIEAFAEWLEPFLITEGGDYPDAFLLDESGGTGRVPDPGRMAERVMVIRDMGRRLCGDYSPVPMIGGGLYGDNLAEIVWQSLAVSKSVGICAQRNLRTEGNLDLGKVVDYLNASFAFFYP